MKRILSLILVMMAIANPLIAEDSKGRSTPTQIGMEFHGTNTSGTSTVHRAPMRICVEAYYDALSKTISIF